MNFLMQSLFSQLKQSTEHQSSWDVPSNSTGKVPHVVILGLGFSGASVAMILQNHARITIVDKKNYFENTCAMHRVIVDPEILSRNQLQVSEFAPKANFVQGEAHLTPEGLFVHGKPLNYDYLVIATGASYQKQFDSPRACNVQDGSKLKDIHSFLRSSDQVAVVGGGAAGIEIASELCEEFPNKEILLFHSGAVLLPRLAIEAQETALSHLSKYKNLQIRFNEKVVNVDKNGSVSTSLGNRFETGVAYLCSGLKPNTQFLLPHFSKCLNLDGSLKVNQYLQVENLKNAFGVGDVAGTGEEYLAGNAFKHARAAARNIMLMEQGKPLETYEPQNRQMGIMLGRRNAMIVKDGNVTSGLSIALRKQAIGLSARILPVFNAFLKPQL